MERMAPVLDVRRATTEVCGISDRHAAGIESVAQLADRAASAVYASLSSHRLTTFRLPLSLTVFVVKGRATDAPRA